MIRVSHDGWQLETYSWSERTGIGTFVYVNGKQRVEIQREQLAYWTDGVEVLS